MTTYQRLRHGRGFRYTTNRGRPVTDTAELDYIKSLSIPPAWHAVTISSDRTAKILAKGTDSAGRQQAIYHPDFRAQQEMIKFERIMRFGTALPKLRKRLEIDLRQQTLTQQKVVACIVKLIDTAYFRVGSDIYARSNHSYGITTLRSKHTTVRGDTVIFDFQGKSGKQQHKVVSDKRIARIIRQLDEQPGYELFRFRDDQGELHDINNQTVNAYIKRYMGDDFTAKDFRTWGGTLVTTMSLLQADIASSLRERKKIVTACVKQTAKKLGNTPAVARQSYIDPRVIQAYIETDEIDRLRTVINRIRPRKYLKTEELCTLTLLKRL